MFAGLPDVLQDLVVQFAFKIDKKELNGDLDLISEIKTWDLHPCFVRHRIFVSPQWISVDNPLKTYFPLQNLKSMFDIFDMCTIAPLDSEKGKSGAWVLGRFGSEFLKWFSSFFNRIIMTPGNLKPMWQGFPLFFDSTKRGFL